MLKSNINFKTTSYTNTLSTPLVLPSSQQSTIPSSITNATLLTPFSHPNNPPLSNHYNSITVHTHTHSNPPQLAAIIHTNSPISQPTYTHPRTRESLHAHTYILSSTNRHLTLSRDQTRRRTIELARARAKATILTCTTPAHTDAPLSILRLSPGGQRRRIIHTCRGADKGDVAAAIHNSSNPCMRFYCTRASCDWLFNALYCCCCRPTTHLCNARGAVCVCTRSRCAGCVHLHVNFERVRCCFPYKCGARCGMVERFGTA